MKMDNPYMMAGILYGIQSDLAYRKTDREHISWHLIEHIRVDAHDEHFAFKHHYITQALDSDVLCAIFMAMHEKREIAVANLSRRANEPKKIELLPIKVLFSVQSGRQYLIAYQRRPGRIKSFRLD